MTLSNGIEYGEPMALLVLLVTIVSQWLNGNGESVVRYDTD